MDSDWLMFPAGVIAGVVNAIAGGGSLLTFPVLVGLGYSPFVANVTNAVGVFASNVGGVVAYREELRDAKRVALVLCAAASIGALGGTAVLLNTDPEAFEAVVPWLIGFASLLIVAQPAVVKRVVRAGGSSNFAAAVVAVGIVAVYGGYFGAAMGVLFLGVYGLFVHESITRVNAIKNSVALVVNGICVLAFSIFAPVAWSAALPMAVGTLAGGLIGGHLARRMPASVLRAVTAAIGIVAAVWVALR